MNVFQMMNRVGNINRKLLALIKSNVIFVGPETEDDNIEFETTRNSIPKIPLTAKAGLKIAIDQDKTAVDVFKLFFDDNICIKFTQFCS